MESNDDIFNHIKSVMRDHEEPYDEGAWERFKAMPAAPVKKGGVVSMWKWATAAAAVIAGVFILARVFNGPDPLQHTESVAFKALDSSATIAQATPEGKSKPDGDFEKTEEATGNSNHNIAVEKSATAAPLYAYKPGARPVIAGTLSNNISPVLQPLVTAPLLPVKTGEVTPSVTPDTEKPEINFWKNRIETPNPQIAQTPVYKEKEEDKFIAVNRPSLTVKPEKEKNKKWQPSVYVSPQFGDLGIDMGYGVSVGYAINDKVKISSGIAYNKLSASRSYGTGATGEMMASASPNGLNGAIGATGAAGAAGAAGVAGRPSLDSKAALTSAYNFVAGPQTNFLQQVAGSLSGIDIPVEVNYNISNKLYASAGVSGLVVINDNKKYTYVDNRNVQVSVETNRGMLKEDKSVTFSEQSTTSQPMQAPTENTPFLGFYNISMGYRQKISGRTGVALEPFLKVPMRNVTQENLKYMGTGIRLKVDL